MRMTRLPVATPALWTALRPREVRILLKQASNNPEVENTTRVGLPIYFMPLPPKTLRSHSDPARLEDVESTRTRGSLSRQNSLRSSRRLSGSKRPNHDYEEIGRGLHGTNNLLGVGRSKRSRTLERKDDNSASSSICDTQDSDSPLVLWTQLKIPQGDEKCLDGLSFVFTGTLKQLDRETGEQLVKSHGGRLMNSPSRQTSYIVLGDNVSQRKLERIADLKLKTIDEHGLFELIQTLPRPMITRKNEDMNGANIIHRPTAQGVAPMAVMSIPFGADGKRQYSTQATPSSEASLANDIQPERSVPMDVDVSLMKDVEQRSQSITNANPTLEGDVEMNAVEESGEQSDETALRHSDQTQRALPVEENKAMEIGDIGMQPVDVQQSNQALSITLTMEGNLAEREDNGVPPAQERQSHPDANENTPAEGKTIQEEGTESQPMEKHQNLAFQIPQDIWKTALDSQATNTPMPWCYTLYRGSKGEKVERFYCSEFDMAERISEQFLNESILGFDMEWKMNCRLEDPIKHNVSLIQVASETRIALFHIALFKGEEIDRLMPPTLKKILENPRIMKCGVNILGDFTRLKRTLDVEARGVFELSHLYNQVMLCDSAPYRIAKYATPLEAQVRTHLGLHLPKGDERTSNWAKQLDEDQKIYAARDAYCAVHLFDVLEGKRKALKPCPERPHFAEEQKEIPLSKKPEVRIVVQEVDENGNLVQKEETKATKTTRSGRQSRAPSCPEVLQADAWFISHSVPTSTTVSTPILRPEESMDSSRISQALPTPLKSELSEMSQISEQLKEAEISQNPEISPEIEASSASQTLCPPLTTQESRDSQETQTSQPVKKQPTKAPQHLRVYHMWQHQLLPLTEIHKILQVKIETVASYLLRALHEKFENKYLEFDSDRMAEVTEVLEGKVIDNYLINSYKVGKYVKKSKPRYPKSSYHYSHYD